MFHFGQSELRVLSFQVIGIYQGGLVSKMLRALAEMLGEVNLSFSLKNVALM